MVAHKLVVVVAGSRPEQSAVRSLVRCYLRVLTLHTRAYGMQSLALLLTVEVSLLRLLLKVILVLLRNLNRLLFLRRMG